MKLMIATPAYDGKVFVPYAVALAETNVLMAMNGIPLAINITTSGSLLVAERNRIVESFMNSDCTHLLCVDSDLGWPCQAVLGLLRHDEEFVCGIYPSRGEKSFTYRPKVNADQTIVQNEKKLLGMEYVPAGFIMLKRSVIEKMRAKFPELYYEPKAEQMKFAKAWMFFGTEIWEGEFWGEDYTFCRKAREAGVDIWCDPLIQFNHAGQIGMLLEVLTENKPEKQNESV